MSKLNFERLLTKAVRIDWTTLADSQALSYEVHLNGQFYTKLNSDQTSCVIGDLIAGAQNNIAVYVQYLEGEKHLLPGSEESIWAFHTPDGLPVDICILTVLPEFECKKRPHMPSFKPYVLLIRRKDEVYEGHWALPGGFSKVDETLDEAAERELKEETGIEKDFTLNQLKTFYYKGRDPRGWIPSVAYFSLVRPEIFITVQDGRDVFKEIVFKELEANTDALEAKLFTIDEALKLELAFDHREVIKYATERMKTELLSTTIARHFLNKKGFTLRELHRLLKDTVPEFQVDETNFSKKLLATKGREGILLVLNEKEQRYAGPKAQLYKFRQEGNEPILSIYNSF
ncbi:NUDIX hydrolase [Gorillibacterium timonense]|uniref:NUDIX hydrolase n=1 Tax=Gorillibacterium timonense TaxID=1689269 RepID=UPI00071D2F42|nr:NUDIX domain-containing protein [Gorillibacterium timonense]